MHKNKMRLNLLLTCFGYFAFGFGFAVFNYPSLGLDTRFTIWIICIAIFFVVVFTAMENIKRVLFKEEKSTTELQDDERSDATRS